MGASLAFTTVWAAIPDATYRWSRNGIPIRGATPVNVTSRLAGVKAGDAGRYTVAVANPSGRATSNAAVLTVKD